MTKKLDNQGEASIKKRVNSKAKGSTFERTIATKLSKALSPLKFIRTPGSGSRTGGKNFQLFGEMFGADSMKLFTGDVVPTNEKDTNLIFHYSLECKSYKTSDSFETMVSGNANIFKWMNESIIDAVKINKIPLIIFKWNNTATYVGILQKDNKQPAKLTLTQNDMVIDILYLDDLLENKSFWITENKT